jgi:tetraacyldisaccharide 4'-kinase
VAGIVNRLLQIAWQRRGPVALLLFPLALLFGFLSGLRRVLYRTGLLKSYRLPVAVIVVGNITAGGTGKTPACIWLAEMLSRKGRRPGIVSRGYGGGAQGTCEVHPESPARWAGDEPVLLRQRTGCPTFIGRDRVAAARALLAAYPQCDVMISDDGLQHYRLQRDIELALMDGRGAGNGWLLPAGPLREPISRLQRVDALVLNGSAENRYAAPRVFRMRLDGVRFHLLDLAEQTCLADDLAGLRLHACAGIGVPARFFDHLSALGLVFVAHPFSDHHRFTSADLAFSDCDALLMTEKDAIKCQGLTKCPIWVLPVTATIESGLTEYLLEKLDGRPPA